jgi:hypothetical protein
MTTLNRTILIDNGTRFSKNLQSMLKGLTDNEILLLGRAIEDIGSHSGRKGSGTLSGPSQCA